MNVRAIFIMALLGALAHMNLARTASAEFVLVSNGEPLVPVVVAEDAPAATIQAAEDLVEYVEKATGARLDLLKGTPEPVPDSAVLVGVQPGLASAFPETDFGFRRPEEIMIVCNGTHLAIAGRDRVFAGNQTEFGTANAVYTFLQKHLDVRWLWPGPLGEDIAPRDTLSFAPFEYRFHPTVRQRQMRYNRRAAGVDEINQWWRFQRAPGSLEVRARHAFGNWWDDYQEDHPEWFALRPDGTRMHMGNPHRVKLCVSNPEVAEEWLRVAEQAFRENPGLTMLSASPNDGGGFCVCDNCLAWDHPEGPEYFLYGQKHVMLTDRYVRFWNILARGLKERFPEHEVSIGAWAYSSYRTPPVEQTLEDNIAIGYVGHFPLTTEEHRQQQKAEWLEWSEKASMLVYRPNLWYWAGGVWGLPEVAMRKTMVDLRFLGENRMVGVDVDTMRLHWATQGPQYYLMAHMMWDPLQDTSALMDDYYRRAFGPAAENMQEYWTLMEDAREAVVESPDFKTGSRNRYNLVGVVSSVYTDEFLGQAEQVLDHAEAKAADAGADAGGRYRERVRFVRAGLEYTRLMMRNVLLMERVRDSQGADSEAVRRLRANWESIGQIAEEVGPHALNIRNIHQVMQGGYMGGVGTHFGPPDEEQIASSEAAGPGPGEQAARPFILTEAEWELAFEDDFERDDLGGDWLPVTGRWTVEDGWLVSGGGSIMTTRRFPGLQRLEFEATPHVIGFGAAAERGAEVQVSDISPFIHAGDAAHRSGYFFQFGGVFNTENTLRRSGVTVRKDETRRIVPGRVHEFVAEFDGRAARLTVDGETVFEYADNDPLLGEDNGHVGLYVYTPAKIRNLRVYTSEPNWVPNPEWDQDEDDPDME